MSFDRNDQRDVEPSYATALRADRRETCVRNAAQGAQTLPLGRIVGERRSSWSDGPHLDAFGGRRQRYIYPKYAWGAAYLGNVG